MLVTDASWAECHPMRRAVARPYQPWRCVAWTNERTNFLLVSSSRRPEDTHLPDGLLIDGPDALLEAVSTWAQASYSVYVLEQIAGRGDVSFSRVTGIWREAELPDGVRGALWYSTSSGDMRRCDISAASGDTPRELVNEACFCEGERVPSVTQGDRCSAG